MGKAAWVLVLVALAARVGFAAFTGLGIDESYMVAAAARFDVSYFDHPGVSWWLELLARWVVGNSAPLTVRAPFVLVSGLSCWLLYRLTSRLYGARAAFWAVTGYCLSPVFSLAFGCWVLPDGPLDAALLAAAYALARALGVGGEAEPRWWWAAGFLAGLALLSKYSAGLVLLGAVMVLVFDPASRPALRNWRPWVAGLVAVAMFAPVVWWNAAHGWQSFHYQSGRAVGLRLHWLAPLSIWGGEALFVLPWLWAPMVVLLARALRRGPVAARADWFLAMLGVVPVVLFALVGFWSSAHILYHWAAPGYLMLLPLLGKWAAGLPARGRNVVAWLSGALLVGAAAGIVAAENLAWPNLDLVFAAGKSPLLQAVDWDSVRPQVAALHVDGVAALRWYDAGKIGYALRGDAPVTVFGAEPHEFGISAPPRDFVGKDLALVAMPGDVSAIARTYAPYFKSLEAAPSLVVIHRGDVLLVIPVLVGRDLLAAPAGK